MKISKTILMVGKSIVVFFADGVGHIAALLSGGTRIHQQDNEDGDLPGLYNYRTGKFDNGTDPYGWYEEDL